MRDENTETVAVFGGGWSVRGVDLNRIPAKEIIGVNDAAFYLPGVTAIVSMDRLWTENRWSQLCDMAKPTWIRKSALKNIKERPDWLHPFENANNCNAMSEHFGDLNGNNSGFCALNLAYLMKPKLIRLYGFDMNRGPDGVAYFYPPYPWAKPRGGTGDTRYAEWAAGFDVAALACANARIEVINMSKTSAITSFRKVKE